MSTLVTPGNLGPEFDLGAIQADKIRLKLGAGLAIQPDGTIVATGTNKDLLLTGGGRWYLNTNNSWVTDSDDNYSVQYYQFAEVAGTGAEPIYEWEHKGMLIPAGYNLEKLDIVGRLNAVDGITDLEYRVVIRHPNASNSWEVTGVNLDTEMTNIVAASGFLKPAGYTGVLNHQFKTSIDLANTPIPEDALVSIYMRPVGTVSARRYLQSTYTYTLS